ncbi:MAG: peptidoglycan-associated lipoprotein [Myxococcota bacterium]|jgi:peptidoglycan-associated lipoprotein
MTRIATLVLISAFFAPGCKKTAPNVMADDVEMSSSNTMETTRSVTTQEQKTQAASELSSNFARVRFELNSDELDDDSMSALTANATILSNFPSLMVEVQGHADEQGTTDYNLALGQRRATAVSRYLQAQGVASDQLLTVSFGEERPAVMGHSESSWSQNRRAEFRVIVPQAGIAGSVE